MNIILLVDKVCYIVDGEVWMGLRGGSGILLVESHVHGEIHFAASDECVGNESDVFFVETVISVVPQVFCDSFPFVVEHIDVERGVGFYQAVDGVRPVDDAVEE